MHLTGCERTEPMVVAVTTRAAPWGSRDARLSVQMHCLPESCGLRTIDGRLRGNVI
jgi:hypothetical protein